MKQVIARVRVRVSALLCAVLLCFSLTAQDAANEKTAAQKDRQTLLYGLDTEIITLLDTLKKEERISYKKEVLELFQNAKTAALKESVISYFAAFKDDSLKDAALAMAEDPYDEKSTTVNLWFRYIAAIKLTDAAPALRELLNDETIDYFNSIVAALGEIGSVEDAEFLLDYMENNDISSTRKQAVLKTLSQLIDPQIAPRLMAIAENTEENNYARMYAAEAVGSIGNEDYVPNLLALYDSTDPAFRASIVKALAGFEKNNDAQDLIVQAIRDSYYKVRIEAITSAKRMKLKRAEPYLLLRAESDPEVTVKYEAFSALAALGSNEGNNFLIGIVTDKKSADTTRVKAAAALLENGEAGQKEIIALAEETLKDDKQKNLRYALGKEFAKYKNSAFTQICADYLAHNDVSTKGTGLDIYAKGRYGSLTSNVRAIAGDTKAGALAAKAQRILAQE